MSILNKKQKIFGSIAAARTLTESMPSLKLNSSFPSMNNKGNIMMFLTDIIKALIGYGALIKAVVDILTHAIDDIEVKIKKVLKKELKSVVSCGVNPSLPDFLKSNGNGIVIQIKKIDFLDLLKVDPKSSSGKLLYNDVTPSIYDSTDFNTFLYGVIQDDGNTHTWKNILNVTFNSLDPNGINPNNSLVIKANANYDLKSLTDLNNNYIDSLKLFNTQSLLNKIIDSIFGSVSVNLNKTKKQLETEAKVDKVIDKLVDSDIGQTIDDSYFDFDNDELSQIEFVADNRQRGVIKIITSDELEASVPEESLTVFNEEIGKAVTIQERKDVLTKHLDLMADKNTKNSDDPTNKQTIKLNFIQNIIVNIIKSIINVVLSPKVIIFFLINFKIIYGPNAEFTDVMDFLKKNKQLIKQIIKKITGLIIELLLAIVLKQIAELVAKEQAKIQIDKAKNKIAQLLSLVGVPQEAIRVIKGLS